MYIKIKISPCIWIFYQNILLCTSLFLLLPTFKATAENIQKSSVPEITACSNQEKESNDTPVQIKLSAEMLVDEVPGSSYWSPAYLVDEQSCNPENGIHPFSRPWKPYFNMDKGPYHVYIDLGENYELTKIAFHEMGKFQDLEILTGEPGKWNHLLTVPCTEFNTWVEYNVSVKSRYLLLSMEEGVMAQVNEIALYGYKTNQSVCTEKGGIIDIDNRFLEDLADFTNDNNRSISLDGNLVNDIIYVNLPDESDHEFTIDIYDLNGLKVFHEEFIYNVSSKVLLNVANECSQSGVYILRYYNNSGVFKTLKFIKRD